MNRKKRDTLPHTQHAWKNYAFVASPDGGPTQIGRKIDPRTSLRKQPTNLSQNGVLRMTSHTTEKTDRTSDARLAMYAPILARLAEPLGFEANDTNLFRYVGNAPTNGVDPTGLEKEYIVIQNHKQKSGVIVHGIEGANLAGGKPSKTGTMAKLLGKVGAEHDVWISNSTDKEPFSRRTFQKHAKAGRKMDPQWGQG